MSKANEPAYPTLLTGKWAGSGSNATFAPDCTEGFTKREAYAKDFIAAWIIALAQRFNEPGYSDWGVVFEATKLGLAQADNVLIEAEKPHD